MFKFLSKIPLIFKFILPLLLLLIVIFSLACYPLLNNTKLIQQKFKSGFTVAYNGEEFKPFADADKEGRFDKIWTDWVSYSPTNPVVTYVTFKKYDYGNDYKYIQFRLKRTALNNFDVEKLTYAFVIDKDLSQDKVLEYAKADFDKNNPAPNSIRIDPAPSREEVQRQKDSQSAADQKLNDPEYQKKYQECYNIGLLHPGQEERYLYDCINPYNREKGYSESK